MAGTGGTPFLASPATGRAATPSSAVFDVEAAGAGGGAHHRAGKAPPPAFVLTETNSLHSSLLNFAPCFFCSEFSRGQN